MWEKPDIPFCVTAKIRQARIKICETCEYKKNFSEIELCTMCNCVISWKTWFKTAECPAKKWGAE